MDYPIINRQPTTTKTIGNFPNSEKNSSLNGTAQPKKIHSNKHEILLGTRYNTTKLFPHILERGEGKPGGICHKIPPNMAPQNCAAKIFETKNIT